MTTKELQQQLEDAIKASGEEAVSKALSGLGKTTLGNSSTLTIVVNEGIHHLPEEVRRGEVFVLTRGMLDLSSQESALSEYRTALAELARKLKERSWKKIYLIPYGPSTLSMQAKLLTYRVTHLETIDLLHNREDGYFEISFDLRQIIAEGE